jgi:magnesium-transporting ATPase (P-type)
MCGFLQYLWGFMDGGHHHDRSLGTTLTLDEVKSMSRDNLERDLMFVSLLLFRNELKKDTRAAIEALREGQVTETTQ